MKLHSNYVSTHYCLAASMKLKAHNEVDIKPNWYMLESKEATGLKLSFNQQQQRNMTNNWPQDVPELQLIIS